MNDVAPGLAASQRAVVDLLKRRGEATVGELEGGTGLARESLRDLLRGLAERGLVERAGVRRAGPGRPAIVYRLSRRGDRLFPERQGELLAELAAFLLASGQRDALERFFAARAESRRERRAARVAGLAGEGRVGAVAALLDEEGFLAEVAPDAAGTPRLRLCHCPWRDLVAVSQVPCRAEMAMVEELIGAPLTREEFMPAGAATCTYALARPATGAPPHDSTPRGEG